MKQLTLMRHAKSSWADTRVSDFDRLLNPRGLRDAPEMGRRLGLRDCPPDLIISSTAARARATAEAVVQQLQNASDSSIRLEWEAAIYEATPGKLLEIIENSDDSLTHLMLVGHNPGIESLAAALRGGEFRALPSAAVCQFELDCTQWAALSDVMTTQSFRSPSNKGESVLAPACRECFFDYPKKPSASQ